MVRATAAAVSEVDRVASRHERTAQAKLTKPAWRGAVRQRAIALWHAQAFAAVLAKASATMKGWDFPKNEALARRILGHHRALATRLAQRMRWQLAADLQRVRRPRPLPATAPQTPRVRQARARARAAAAAVRKVTGTRPDTYPAGGELSEIWAAYSRRLPPITSAMSRAAKPLGRAVPRRERRARLALLRRLVVLYRNEARQVEHRVKAAGGPCRARFLAHVDNTLLRAIEIERLIAAVEKGERRFITSAIRQIRMRAARGRAIAKGIRRCLPGALGNVSEALCPQGLTTVADEALTLVEAGTFNPGPPIRTDPNTNGGFNCSYRTDPPPGLVPATMRVQWQYRRDGSTAFCGTENTPGSQYLNSATHALQVFVDLRVDGADRVRRTLLATLEAASVATRCSIGPSPL